MKWGAFITGTWAAAVLAVWWLNVPFAPEYVLSQQISSPIQISPQEMLTSAQIPRIELNSQRRRIGPVDVRDVQTGEVLRSYLDANWALVAFDVETRGRLAIRTGRLIRVLKAGDGAVLCQIEPVTESASMSFGAGGKLLLVEDEAATSAYDAETGHGKWTKAGAVSARLQVGPDLVAMTAPQLQTAQKGTALTATLRHCTLVDWETGDENQALKGNRPMAMFGSKDGRFLLLREAGTWTVLDAMSGERLWKVPQPGLSILWFSEEGSEVHVPYRFKDGPAGLARWKSEDGTVLAEFPKGALNADLKISADGRYAYERRQHSWLPQSVSAFFRSRNFQKLADLTAPVVAPVIIDLEQQRILGRLPADEQYAFQIPGPGFLCYDKNGKGSSYYSFPPGRNWTWLFRWAVLPPVAVWMLMQLRRRWRTRRTSVAVAA